jgi:P pilus assembly chaperone PapD
MSLRLLPLAAFAMLAAAVLVPSNAIAQVSVTPTRIFLTPGERSGDVTVINPAAQPMVVTARLYYSIYRNDSTGGIVQDSMRTGDAMERPCVDWLRMFPKQFTLQPGEKRVVRIMATPPAGLADGEYIARVDIRGKLVERPTEVTIDTNGIRTNLGMNLGYSLPIFFRKGKLTTKVELDVKRIDVRDGRPWARVAIRTIGNASFRGTLRAVYTDLNGKVAAKKEHALVSEVGYDYPLEIPSLPAGLYTVRLEAVTKLPGKAQETVVMGETTTATFSIDVASSKSVTLAASR